MSAKQFSREEWKRIRETLDKDPEIYGLPKREYGSVLIGSFNIRKLGSTHNRSPETWEFVAHICSRYDLLAVQEIMDDLNGLKRLMGLLGPDFGMIVSDKTGTFPGEPGLGERLGFIFHWSVVHRTEVATDITYDRTKVIDTIAHHIEDIYETISPYAKEIEKWETQKSKAKHPKRPKMKMPVFLTFIRQPFCVSFEIVGNPGTIPYKFMAINAHLYFGEYMSDRRQEFHALMQWIIARMMEKDKSYYPNFILLGDLNLDFDNPAMDRKKIEEHIKSLNRDTSLSGEKINVYFPFLDPHPRKKKVFRTNVRLTETFDQIGLFSRDNRFPTYKDKPIMGKNKVGPDYGVFNFVNLFSVALNEKGFDELHKEEKKNFIARFEHKVSDHMPLWLRLPLP